MDRNALIAQLQQAGVKHNPDNILRIAKKPDGKIVFLEAGNDRSGWQHIRSTHAEDFAKRGIPKSEIIDVVMAAVTEGKILGTQETTRTIYEVEYNGETQYISVDLGSNG